MVPNKLRRWSCLFPVCAVLVSQPSWGAEDGPLSFSWSNEMLSMRGAQLCGGEISVHYLEAFCRPGATRRDWKETVIPHRTRLVEASADQRLIRLRTELDDGVVVDHEIRAGHNEVDFRVVAKNPGATIRDQLAGDLIDCDTIHSSALVIRARPSSPPWISPILYRITQPQRGMSAASNRSAARASWCKAVQEYSRQAAIAART